jgi:tetratricopeptide (TPR) repeat protein
MPARMALERGDWAAAARLPVASSRFAFTEAITVFARALGSARGNDVPAAEREAERLAGLHKALIDAKNNYWATEVEVQRLAAAAWIAQARKQPDDALRLMRAAADLEDRNEKHIVTPGRVVPARELLGEMLLEQGQPAAALAEFEQSQQREPNRLRGFVGAARAAEAAGDSAKARQHAGRLIELTRDADSPLPDVARVKTLVGMR